VDGYIIVYGMWKCTLAVVNIFIYCDQWCGLYMYLYCMYLVSQLCKFSVLSYGLLSWCVLIAGEHLRNVSNTSSSQSFVHVSRAG